MNDGLSRSTVQNKNNNNKTLHNRRNLHDPLKQITQGTFSEQIDHAWTNLNKWLLADEADHLSRFLFDRAIKNLLVK